jgi:uncharacterized HAD superfamily protein
MNEKIGVDLDDTAFDFVGALILFHNAVYHTNLTFEQFTSHRFSEIWGGTGEEAVRKVAYFSRTKYFEEMQPILGAVEAIAMLAQDKYLDAITSRPADLKERTARQVTTHFGNNFERIFHSYNHFTEIQNEGTKLEICLRENISIMIEDSLEYAMQFANTDIRVLLFGDYPWNQNGTLPSNILRVKTWKEVLEKIT